VLSIREEKTVTPVSIVAPFGETMNYFGGLSHYVNTPVVMNSLVSVSLAAPNSTTLSPRDTWGNVKLPAARYVHTEALEYQSATANQLSASKGQGLLPNETEYSSLIGVPLWDVPEKGNLTFDIEWPIFDTDCQWQRNLTELEYCQTCYQGNETCFVNQSLEYWVDGWPKDCDVSEYAGLNYTNLELCQLCDGGRDSCFLNSTVNGTVDGWPYGCRFDSQNMYLTSNDLQQVNSTSSPHYLSLAFTVYAPDSGSSDGKDVYSTTAECILRTTHVTATVSCAEGVCEIYGMRESSADTRPAFLNPVSCSALLAMSDRDW
jgi:hypothetical protein